jgi:hypothetical protein
MYLTWGLIAMGGPAIFMPRHLSAFIVIPVVFAWTIIAIGITGLIWRGLAAVFGFELPPDEDD